MKLVRRKSPRAREVLQFEALSVGRSIANCSTRRKENKNIFSRRQQTEGKTGKMEKLSGQIKRKFIDPSHDWHAKRVARKMSTNEIR